MTVFFTNVYSQEVTPALSTPELIEADVTAGNLAQENGYLYLT